MYNDEVRTKAGGTRPPLDDTAATFHWWNNAAEETKRTGQAQLRPHAQIDALEYQGIGHMQGSPLEYREHVRAPVSVLEHGVLLSAVHHFDDRPDIVVEPFYARPGCARPRAGGSPCARGVARVKYFGDAPSVIGPVHVDMTPFVATPTLEKLPDYMLTGEDPYLRRLHELADEQNCTPYVYPLALGTDGTGLKRFSPAFGQEFFSGYGWGLAHRVATREASGIWDREGGAQIAQPVIAPCFIAPKWVGPHAFGEMVREVFPQRVRFLRVHAMERRDPARVPAHPVTATDDDDREWAPYNWLVMLAPALYLSDMLEQLAMLGLLSAGSNWPSQNEMRHKRRRLDLTVPVLHHSRFLRTSLVRALGDQARAWTARGCKGALKSVSRCTGISLEPVPLPYWPMESRVFGERAHSQDLGTGQRGNDLWKLQLERIDPELVRPVPLASRRWDALARRWRGRGSRATGRRAATRRWGTRSTGPCCAWPRAASRGR